MMPGRHNFPWEKTGAAWLIEQREMHRAFCVFQPSMSAFPSLAAIAGRLGRSRRDHHQRCHRPQPQQIAGHHLRLQAIDLCTIWFI